MNPAQDKMFGIKVFGALFLLMFLIYAGSLSYQNEEHNVVKSQLNDLQKKGYTEAYYAYTSKDFQEATSLANFKKFIANFPLFTSEHTLQFEPSQDPTQVNVLLKGADGQLNLRYLLVKVDKDWKIQSIEAVNDSKGKDVPDFDVSRFEEPIKKHIEALRKSENKEAYSQTTEAFQSSTPFTEFEDFIKEFPVFLTYEKLNFKKLTFNNNVGTYNVELLEKNGDIYDLKYDLIKENGVWKILQIQISNTPLQE